MPDITSSTAPKFHVADNPLLENALNKLAKQGELTQEDKVRLKYLLADVESVGHIKLASNPEADAFIKDVIKNANRYNTSDKVSDILKQVREKLGSHWTPDEFTTYSALVGMFDASDLISDGEAALYHKMRTQESDAFE